MTKITYNQPIEVTEQQKKELLAKLPGCVFGRKDQKTGKCYIKVAEMDYADVIQKYLAGKITLK